MTQLSEFHSIQALSDALHKRQISATELATDALRAARGHSDANVFLHIDDDLTLAQARDADQALAGGQAGPLTGIPIAHKDLFVTRGWRTTAASRMLADQTEELFGLVSRFQLSQSSEAARANTPPPRSARPTITTAGNTALAEAADDWTEF